MTGYGPIDILWLDGGQVRPRNRTSRWTGWRRWHGAISRASSSSTGPWEESTRTTAPPSSKSLPSLPITCWETCMTMGDQWSYKPGDRYKSTHQLVHLLVNIIAKGGNFLLNVGPQPDGRFPEEARSRLHEIGAWMKVNSEAVYGTRAVRPYFQDKFAFTRKGPEVFAFYLMGESEDRLSPHLRYPVLPA